MELNKNIPTTQRVNIKDIFLGITCILITIIVVFIIVNWSTVLSELKGNWQELGKGILIGLCSLPIMIFLGIKVQDHYSNVSSPNKSISFSDNTVSHTNKKSMLLLTSLIISSIYIIYILNHFFGDYNPNSIGETFVIGIALPHIMLSIAGLILNVIAYIKNKKGLILFTAILYTISAMLFLLYSPFLIPSIILCFFAWYKCK